MNGKGNTGMAILTDEIKSFVEGTQLCFVATVNEDGTPNLSPKGSLAVFDGEHLVFANIASPDTVENLRRNPAIEINIVDIFRRRGYRLAGTATLMPDGTPEYDFVADPLWAEHGNAYPVHEVVKVHVSRVKEVRSPAYTYGEGVTEASLRSAFVKKYSDAQDAAE